MNVYAVVKLNDLKMPPCLTYNIIPKDDIYITCIDKDVGGPK